MFEKSRDERRAVLGEERKEGVKTLLEMAFGKERTGEIGGAAGDALVAAQGFAGGFAAVLVELIAHLGDALGEGRGEGGIKALESVLKRHGGVENSLVGSAEEGIEIGRQELFCHAVAEHGLRLKAIGEGKVETIEQRGGAAVEQGEAGAGHNDRHAVEERRVEDRGLREVGDLGGTADVGDGRQEVVLHHGTQERVGGEGDRRGGQCGGFVAVVAMKIRAGAAAQGDAAAALEQQEQRAVGLEEDLGVVAGGAQFRATRQESFGERIGIIESLRQQGRGGGTDSGVEGIEEDQVEAAEQRGEERAKSIAQGAAGLVGGGHFVEDAGGEGEAVEKSLQLVDGDRFEFQGTDGLAGETTRVRGEPVRLVGGVEDPAMVGLGEVVILGSHPENGHGGNAGGGELAGEFDGGEGLIEGVAGTAEEADLLAGDDGDGGGVFEGVEGG